eukprot:symbB.v1.2.021520.t1/scaffold1859.1/size98302/6
MGGQITKTWSPQVTHLVASRLRRTFKTMHQPDENYEWSYGRTGGESQQSTWSGYGYWEGEWGHSSGIPRTSSGRDETASDSAGRGAAGEEYGTEASNHGSGSNDRKKPVTGKEVVPSYNGESALREYRRRVDLFLATTGIDEEFRAGRLMEKLEGRAWQATQTLQVSRLRSSEGVQYLLDHLQKELEPVEHLQIFNTLHEFFRGFKRSRGEEFSTYDTRFRAQLQKMEEIGAPLDGLVRSYWFLEGSGISAELRKQVISAAGGSYNYEKLRAALVAIVPTVKRDESEAHGRVGNGAGDKAKFERRGYKPHGVHAVEEDGDGAEEHHGEEEGINGEIDDEEALAMEQEAQVLLTQAAKRRSMAERGRGYQRVESTEERESRIKHMKTKMVCSACRAHGKTTFGHWHADKACPYYEESMAMKKKKEGEKSNKVFVVQGDEDEDEEDTDSDQPAYEVMITWSGVNQQSGLAMTDTCCARTVVGEEWAEKHMESMWKQGVEFLVVNEQQPFRFGPGRRIYSTFALIFPMAIQDEKKIAVVRASVVPQKVPLLLSKRVLADLGATMFLRKECIEFEELGTTTKLITTDNDQVAIKIDDYQERHREISNEVLLDVLRDDEEPDSVTVTGSRMSAPKLKAEFVEEISKHCNVSKEELKKHDLPRLKEIWMVVKPNKPIPVLPVGWKRANLDTLREMYLDLVVEDLGRPKDDKHWVGWKRSQFLLEIDLWSQDIEETHKTCPPECTPVSPTCPTCDISMVRRTNRLSRVDFWGCLRFPLCRETLSLTYNGQPVEVMQNKMKSEKAEIKAEKVVKKVAYGDAVKRSSAPLGPSSVSDSGSWEMADSETGGSTGRMNMNLTMEEMKMIMQSREAKGVSTRVPDET